jgi:hypothetical protein
MSIDTTKPDCETGAPKRCTKPRTVTYNPAAPRIGPGVYGLEDIRQRCHVDDVTGCWEWALAISEGGKPHSSRTPRVCLPSGVMEGGGRSMSVARASWLMSGRKIRPGCGVWRTCCNDACVAPGHLKSGTKVEEGAWMAASGHRRGKPWRAAVNRRTNAACQAVPVDVVRAIEVRLRAGELHREISADTGIHKATISKIARGRHMHQRGGGLVRGASVFALAEPRA